MKSRVPHARIEQLGRVPLFRTCSDRELTAVDALVDDARLDAGAVLTSEGAPGRQCFVIVSGHAEVSLRGELLARRGPGDIVGEMALLKPGPRTATVTAATPMDVLVLTPPQLGALLRIESVARRYTTELIERIRSLESSAVTAEVARTPATAA